ncbi:MAG: hypothetical protein H6624_19055 [Bdellovibrionaceae bacterium]|nr:hypothetical protein [Bdellovibrionales bacterium]MCB9086447.1 hypothetical protein [Pseudobdellovibrionaceae bacterium]
MKFKVFKKSILIVSIALMAMPTGLWAAVRNPFVLPHEAGIELDLSAIEKIRPKEELARIQTELYIPVNIAASSDETYVATRILTHSVGTLLESPELRKTSVGYAAYTINESMNTQVTFRPDGSDVKHRVRFQVKAAETVAAVNYEGYVNAKLAYRIDNSNLDFEMTKSLDPATTLVFNHSDVPGETKDLLSLRWVF